MPVFQENPTATITEQIKLRKPRSVQEEAITVETDPNPSQKGSSKSTISSLFLSPFSSERKKVGGSLRGLGCSAGGAEKVTVPGVIRRSAEWEGKKKKGKRKKESGGVVVENGEGGGGGLNCMVVQDVWCGTGIGLGSDAVVGSVECVNGGNRRSGSVRGMIDLEKIRGRERDRERLFLARRAAVNPETLSFLDTDPAFVTSHTEPEVFGTRYYRHVRHPSPDGFAEIMMLQNSLVMGGRMDRFRGWRLDIDHMSYEQLLELTDRIGYVSTGLKDDEISRCVGKLKVPIPNDLPSKPTIMDKKCSVCQEEYEADDELGKLDCGHSFHVQCIKQWLAHKKICPVCKTEPVARG